MAFLAFQDLGGAAATRRAHVEAGNTAAPADDHLSALEWSVVWLARRDGRASLRAPGRVAGAMRAWLRRPNPKLADLRLEALRRMAVLTWQDGYTVPSHEIRDFLSAGFTAEQYETMVDSIGVAKAARLRRH